MTDLPSNSSGSKYECFPGNADIRALMLFKTLPVRVAYILYLERKSYWDSINLQNGQAFMLLMVHCTATFLCVTQE